ncbi:diaminopimelate epimerase [Iamia sp. SCSIO 61187]|uniref:diaminopimelate epimerase n=1 Tax=Iamia sp. SCSIO 61187 TaxID=2722752 RepID=UPI001C635F83|nr:diaminopimelate epimerase [Iamia sp. SCSIO 61187]QYG92677.1 diaminopimelate epimerase [Iamia sp. SCSIO 61187]
MTFRLSKHHGLGNDFLVLLGPAAVLAPIGPDHAVRWCHRHTGVGADGLLLGVTDPPVADDGPVDLAMTLFNADGSRAEMSGNGIRCLAHAEAVRRGVTTIDLRIATDGGLRTVAVTPGPDPATVAAAVDMGPARPGPSPDREPDAGAVTEPIAFASKPLRTATVDLGNPHLVLLVDDPAQVDVHRAGPHWEAGYDAGINVHAIAPTPGATDDLTMAIWERGAGATLACGTGATAAAHAAHGWGLVGDRVRVRMPGGDVEVEVGERLMLHGPSVRIATVEVDA